VLADAPRVFGELRLARDFVRRVDGFEVGRHRRLGVDDHAFPAGQTHDQVGPQRAVLAFDVHLLVEVAILEHPAISTTRRSCTSPQRPLTRGEPSALTRFDVSRCSVTCVSASPRTCCVSPP